MKNYPSQPKISSKNSAFGDIPAKSISGLPIFDIRNSTKKGKEPKFDIVDEAIHHLRTNIFLSDFPVKTGADKIIIFLTFYGMKCIKFINKNKNDRSKCQLEFDSWNLKPFPIPGDETFIISSYVTQPDIKEKSQITEYIRKLRTEMGNRLLEIIFKDDPKEAEKWWIAFSNRKFLGEEMIN